MNWASYHPYRKNFPGLTALRVPFFQSRAAAVIFRGTSRTIFSPATALPFFSWLRAPNTPLIAPLLELLALHAKISPRASAAVVLGALRALFFPPMLYNRLFYDTSCSKHTPV